MNNIQVLEKHTADQIAAGEVAERPALVIKELIENSIDAGATTISVRLKDSGQSQIRITDNGQGIARDDMALAFLRHATSKLRVIDDLDSLVTMGFRGEALASIAAVARVRIVTKTADADSGYALTIDGGTQGEISRAAANTGTDLTVDDLFFNTPARKHFMATPTAELREICDIVGRLIIAHPGIAFTLSNDEKRIYMSAGSGDSKAAIMSVYGKDLVDRLLPLVAENFAGYVSHPSYHKPARSYYHFFLNGRTIRSELLNRAVEDAYRTLMPERRFPVVFINITLPPSDFDVNVHPNKLEVKFKHGNDLKEQIAAVIRRALQSAERAYDQTPRDLKLSAPTVAFEKTAPSAELPAAVPPAPAVQAAPDAVTEPTWRELVFSNLPVGANVPPLAQQQDIFHLEATETAAAETATTTDFYGSLAVIGQWGGAFILAAAQDELYMIDQHAAHERLLFNRICATIRAGEAECCELLTPLELNLNYRQYGWVLQNILELRKLGFILEEFGSDLFLVRAVPVWAKDIDVVAFLNDFADGWLESGKSFDVTHILDHKLMTRACKSAVKANQYLTNADIRYLLDALDHTPDNFTCPHGRPIAIHFSMAEIRRRFLRS